MTGKGDFLHIAGPQHERFQVARAIHADYDHLPRAEIQPPEIEPQDTSPLSNMPEERGPGRPPNLPDSIAVAHYLWYGDQISIRLAKRMLGLSKRGHYLNRDFARKVKAEIMRIKAKGAKA